MKNPIMTRLAADLGRKLRNLSQEDVEALKEEIRKDYPKSKFTCVISELLPYAREARNE